MKYQPTKEGTALAGKYAGQNNMTSTTMRKQHTIYGVGLRGTTKIIYIGCTSNFKRRIKNHSLKKRVGLMLKKLMWFPMMICRSQIKGHQIETELIARLKETGDCQFNMRPSSSLNLIESGRKWKEEMLARSLNRSKPSRFTVGFIRANCK